jgi:hypothetical protein
VPRALNSRAPAAFRLFDHNVAGGIGFAGKETTMIKVLSAMLLTIACVAALQQRNKVCANRAKDWTEGSSA